jgi:BirA family biotin operon repressor/biotin-[acetyl-CoA-carboxylase] ligase
MDIACDFIAQKCPEGTVIQAGEQTVGRGRRGNAWSSPKGNLYQSLILKPDLPKNHWGQLSFVIAVALYETCIAIGIDKNIIQLKWPNDILLDEKKCAGILLEVIEDHIVIGTGVNIANCPDDKSKINDYILIECNDFRDVFLEKIMFFYSYWQSNGFKGIKNQWLEHAYKIGEVIQARLPNVIYDGIFEGLDENGTLLLREKDGLLRLINSGEILSEVRK